jgi:aminocarboxymuconate-semialdehyde decarboxylase
MNQLGAGSAVESYSLYGEPLQQAAARDFADGEPVFIARWIEQMEAGGVDLTIASLGALQPYFPGAGPAVRAARYANAMLADAVALGGGRIQAFGSLPLPHAAAAAEEVAFCLDECGFTGINLGPSAGGRPLDDPAFDDVWAALDERHAVIHIHPGAHPRMGVGSADFGLAPFFGGPAEMAFALVRLVLAKIPIRYPNITVIAANLGGTIPFLVRRFDERLRTAQPDLYEDSGGIIGQFQRFWYDTNTGDPGAIECVRCTYGVDRLVLGSDTPGAPVTRAIESIESSESLGQDEKARILDRNGGLAVGRA